MNNTKLFLLIGTSLSLIPTIAFAQCVATQDCATLGYTETSCSGGSGVKCPFGNKWACFKSESEIKDQLCTDLGFTISCTGTGYSGGVGKICNGKYTACTCKSDYEWKDGKCQQILNGAKGDLYYCNGTVVGVKASGMDFYVAMKDLGEMTWNEADYSCQSYSFCGNVKGKLPTREQLLSIYHNLSTVNSLLSTNGGTMLTNDYYWSSEQYEYFGDEGYSYILIDVSSGKWSDGWERVHYLVRPVLSSFQVSKV